MVLYMDLAYCAPKMTKTPESLTDVVHTIHVLYFSSLEAIGTDRNVSRYSLKIFYKSFAIALKSPLCQTYNIQTQIKLKNRAEGFSLNHIFKFVKLKTEFWYLKYFHFM